MPEAAKLTIDAEYTANITNIASNITNYLKAAENAAKSHKIRIDIDQTYLNQQINAAMQSINSIGSAASGKGATSGKSTGGKASSKKAAKSAVKQYNDAMSAYRKEVLKAQKANADVILAEDGRTLTGTQWRSPSGKNSAQAKYLNTLAKDAEKARRLVEAQKKLNDPSILKNQQKLDAEVDRYYAQRQAAVQKREATVQRQEASKEFRNTISQDKKAIRGYWNTRSKIEKDYVQGKSDVHYDEQSGAYVGSNKEAIREGNHYKKQYDGAISRMKEMGNEQARLNGLTQLNTEMELKNASAMEKLAPTQEQVLSAIDQHTQFADKYSGIKDNVLKGNVKGIRDGVTALQEYNQQFDKLSNVDKARRFNEITSSIQKNETALSKAGTGYTSLGGKITSTLKQYASYYGVSRAIMGAVNSVKQMVSASIEIESAMNRIQIVTGASNKEMSSFFETASNQAQDLGKSITDVAGSIETFSRLGYNLEEASELSKYATIMANVADTDVDTATTGITSIIKGYGMDPSDAEHVSDVLVDVGQKYAISAEELMAAFERGGAALAASGTTFEESAGLFAATNASLQNAATTGTMWKTVSARLRGSKTELEELGEDTGDLAKGLSKYRDEFLAITGIDIMKNANEYKNPFQIFTELADVWESIDSDTKRARAAEILGGTRQLSGVMSTITNIADAKGAYETAVNSAGAATKANDKYMETTAAHIGQLKATFQELSADFINSSFLKGFVDSGNALLKVVDGLVDGLGGLGSAGVAAGIAGIIKLISTIHTLRKTGQSLAVLNILSNAFPKLSKPIVDISGFMGKWQAGTMTGAQALTASFARLVPLLKVAGPLLAGFAAYKYFDYINSGWTRAQESADKAVSKYKDAQSELDSLRDQENEQLSQAQDIASKYNIDVEGIEDVDSVISKIEHSDKGIKLVDQAELSKLSQANKELEASLKIQESVAKARKEAAITETTAASQIEKSYWEEIKGRHGKGFLGSTAALFEYLSAGPKNPQPKVTASPSAYLQKALSPTLGNMPAPKDAEKEADKADKSERQRFEEAKTTNLGLAEMSVKDLEKQKKELKKLEKEILDQEGGATKEQKKKREELNKSIAETGEQTAEYLDKVSSEMEIFSEDNSPYARSYMDNANEVLKKYRQIDMTPAEKAYDNLQSFFDGSLGKNAIKKELEEARHSTTDLEAALSNLGLSVKDIGVDSIEQLKEYLDESATSAKKASDATGNFRIGVGEVEKAAESENQDKGWSSIQQAYQTAKEMLKEGKTGTDDFQTMAQFLSPDNLRKAAEKAAKETKKNGGYIGSVSDVYQNAFEKARSTANRWFGEDETKSMENFVNDFQGKGLFNVRTDDRGLWYIKTNFETTAEAADKFGISVGAVETMLDSLEAYGYDFSGIERSGELLSEYQSNLTSLKEVYDSMDEGEGKDRVGSLIKGFEKEYETFEGDLSKLSEEQVVRIKFEYDLAQIQNEIDAIQGQIDSGDNSVENYAQVISLQDQYNTKRVNQMGLNRKGIKMPVEYTTSKKNEAALRKDLQTATGKEKVEIQAKISNEQKIQKDFLDNFSKKHPKITPETDVKKVNKALNGVKDKKVKVKADTEGKDKVDSLKKSTDGVNSKNVKVTATTSGADKLQAMKDALAKLGSKTITIAANVLGINKGNGKSKGKGNSGGSGKKTSVNGTAFARGNWGANGSGTALGGELGTELLVRDGRWYTIGDNGAEFFKYKKDDIIFNAEQTKQLFEKGKITYGNPRGSALVNGNAFAEGTAFLLGNKNKNKSGSTGTGGTGKSGGSDDDKNKDKTDKQLESFKKWLSKFFDWIEVKLARQAKIIDTFTNRAERAASAGRPSVAASNYSVAIAASRTQLKNEQKAKDKYDRQAEKILKRARKKGLLKAKGAKSIRDRDASGRLVISEYGERLQTVVQEYQKWKDKSREAAAAIEEISQNITDYYKKIADAYRTNAESQISLFKQQSGNKNTPEGKNSYLDKAASQYDTIVDKTSSSYKKVNKIVNTNKKGIKKMKLRRYKGSRYGTLKKSVRNAVKKTVKAAQKRARKGLPITASTMRKLDKYYAMGAISGTFYSKCIAYNNALDARQDLNNQLAIDRATATEEKRAIGQEKLENVQNSYDRSIKSLEADQSLIESEQNTRNTKGYKAETGYYKDIISESEKRVEVLKDEKEALEAVIASNLENKYWTKDTAEYKEALIAVKEIDISIQDLDTSIQEANNDMAQIPYDRIEEALELIDSFASLDESDVSLKTAMSIDLDTEDYEKQMRDNDKKIAKLNEKLSQANSDYAKAVNNRTDPGVYGGKTADEYQIMINEIQSEINGVKEANEELKDSLRDDILWRAYERAHDATQRLADLVSGIAELISDDMLFKNGALTEYGVAHIANLTKQYELAREEVENYSNDIENLNRLYRDGYYSSEEYKEKLAEIQVSMLDSASDMKSYLEDIMSVYKDLDQAELDALFKLIDARNDALAAKKEYYDYDKTIRSKTKDIQELNAQIAAIEGVDTAEAKAQRAKLQEQLSEAQEDLEDTQLDHYMDMMQGALSDLRDTLQDEFDDKWENLSGDLTKMIELLTSANELASANTSTIKRTLDSLLRFYAIDPQETGVDVAYASGTRRVKRNVVGLSNEKGTELLVTKNGIISHFNPGDGVVPADLTARLYDLAQNIKPSSSLGNTSAKGLSTIGAGLSITQNYGSLINIQGSADAATVSDLKRMSKDLLEKSYDYTSKRITQDYIRTGGLRRA